MTRILFQLAVFGCLALVVYLAARPRYVFAIRVEGGEPRVRKGKVTANFVSAVADICRRSGVRRGWIGGVRRGRRVALAFSRHFPEGTRQQVRNEWMVSGW